MINNKSNLLIHKTTAGNVVFSDYSNPNKVYSIYPQETKIWIDKDIIGQSSKINIGDGRENFSRLQIVATKLNNDPDIPFNGATQTDTDLLNILDAFFIAPTSGTIVTGLATEANQETQIAELQAIKNNQTNGNQKTQIQGTVNVNTGLTQPLTNTELRASPVPVTFTQTQNPQYTAAIHYTIGNTPTDFFGITGSATKTIKVLSIKIYAQESQLLGSGNIRNMSVIRRSTANTGGTTTAVARVPLDSNYAAATANILAYTANPTVGTTVGNVGAQQLTHPLASTTSAQFGMELLGQPVILRGVAQGLYLNGLGVTRPNNVYSITIQWEEI